MDLNEASEFNLIAYIFADSSGKAMQATMNFFACLLVLIYALETMAFAPQRHAFSLRPTPVVGNSALYERPDASAAIAHALEMSKEFGPTSKEAALAWDIVEELDSSDNRFVFSALFDVKIVVCLMVLCR